MLSKQGDQDVNIFSQWCYSPGHIQNQGVSVCLYCFLYVCTVPLRVSAGPSLGELFWVGFDLAAPNWPHYQQAVFFYFMKNLYPSFKKVNKKFKEILLIHFNSSNVM